MSASSVLKRVAIGVDRLKAPPAGVTILIYHRVGGGTESRVDLPVDQFRAQLDQLRSDHDVLGLDEAADRIESGDDRPGVVVTFDDGTPDWVDHVAPALVEFAVPATFYVATAFVDDARPFPSGPAISWSALRELHAVPGVTIGSHTHRHTLLDRVDAATAAEELDTSIDRLGTELGIDVAHFAYPKALLGSPAAETEVRARFRTATIATSRPNRPGTDLHRLARTPVQTTDDTRFFTAKAAGGMWFEDAARDIINKIRYRGAET